MALVEIQLNRLGINSVEYSPNVVDASPGTAVHVHITNFGAPAHITLKVEGSEFTSYTYDNIYIEGETEVHIPVLTSAPDGTFAVQVITGYGMRRDQFQVAIHHAPPQPEPLEETPLEAMMRQEKEASEKKQSSGSGRAGRFVLAMIAPAVGLAFLLIWYFLKLAVYIPPFVMGIILFVVMLIGVFIAWFSAK